MTLPSAVLLDGNARTLTLKLDGSPFKSSRNSRRIGSMERKKGFEPCVRCKATGRWGRVVYDRLLEVISEQPTDVVDGFHGS